LFPAFDSGEDAVGICGLDEGFWFGIGFQDERSMATWQTRQAYKGPSLRCELHRYRL